METKINKTSSNDRTNSTVKISGTVFCLLGFITGALVFSRAYSLEDMELFNLAFSQELASSHGFTSEMLGFLQGKAVIVAAVLLFTFSPLGWLAIPGILFAEGLSVGTAVCCLCASRNIELIISAIAVELFPCAVFCAGLLFIYKDAVGISHNILLWMCRSGVDFCGMRAILHRLPLGILFIIAASLIRAGAVSVLCGGI